MGVVVTRAADAKHPGGEPDVVAADVARAGTHAPIGNGGDGRAARGEDIHAVMPA